MNYTLALYESITATEAKIKLTTNFSGDAPSDFIVYDGQLWELSEQNEVNLRYNLKQATVAIIL